jgi:hypothetical protein
MMINADDPRTWPLKIPIIAHDVARSSDRSTAVVGGNCPFTLGPRLLGVKEFVELPLGLYGSELANKLAAIDQTYNHDCLIVADLSHDATYGETLFDTFGRRVIGVQIGRFGDGTTWAQRPVRHGAILVYNVGRTFLLELLLAELRDGRVRFANSAESERAYAQLMALEREQRESGIVYTCPPGQHDDLAISLAMLAWAAQHLHLEAWTRPIFDAHRPRRQRQQFGWEAFT